MKKKVSEKEEMMDRSEMKGAFGALVAEEPPFHPDLERVVRMAGRHRRKGATARVLVTTSVAAVAAALAVTALPREAARENESANERLSLLSFASSGSDPGGAPRTFERGESSNEFEESILPTIRANSPEGFRFDLHATEVDDATLLIDGTADDGQGEGRLFIVMTSAKGSNVEDPCSDPEFRQGAPCSTETLADGSRLILREAADPSGLRTLAAVLVRPDGSGIYAESANWNLLGQDAPQPVQEEVPPQSGGSASSSLEPTRPAPAYTNEGFARLIQALDSQN